jgi:hypothetical protein
MRNLMHKIISPSSETTICLYLIAGSQHPLNPLLGSFSLQISQQHFLSLLKSFSRPTFSVDNTFPWDMKATNWQREGEKMASDRPQIQREKINKIGSLWKRSHHHCKDPTSDSVIVFQGWVKPQRGGGGMKRRHNHTLFHQMSRAESIADWREEKGATRAISVANLVLPQQLMICGTANAMATALNSLSSFLSFFLSNANKHKTDFQLAILLLLPSNRVLGWLVSRSLLCDKSLANGSERPVTRDPSAIPRGSRIP